MIPLPTALSNAQDLRPGAWPEGHPMSRVRSDGELKEITWLTAKVREEKEERRFVVFAIDKKAGRRELKKPENQKKKKPETAGRPPRAPNRGPHRRLALFGAHRSRGRDVPDPLLRRAE